MHICLHVRIRIYANSATGPFGQKAEILKKKQFWALEAEGDLVDQF